jgi:hypothetical protein
MENQITQMMERLTRLEEAVFGSKAHAVTKEEGMSNKEDGAFDFTLNERAFVKRYSEGANARSLNGQQTFVLLCSYLAEGKDGIPVGLVDIRNLWGKCLGIIGSPFRRIYATRAKDNGWVDTSKDLKATYVLRNSWRQALG